MALDEIYDYDSSDDAGTYNDDNPASGSNSEEEDE
jgi:hypothetical protein